MSDVNVAPRGMTPQERARRNRPYRSSRRRSYVVLGFLALNVGWGIAATSIGFGGQAALDPSLTALLDLQPVLLLTTGISWVVWQHRLSANLWPLGRTLGHTPDAVGWWFVPLLDLVWPFLVMRELWNATGPGEETSAPTSGGVGVVGGLDRRAGVALGGRLRTVPPRRRTWIDDLGGCGNDRGRGVRDLDDPGDGVAHRRPLQDGCGIPVMFETAFASS